MQIPKILKNKYFWIIAVFLVIMLFFDANSMLHQIKLSRNLSEARSMNAFYKEEIKRQEEFLKNLNSDDDFAEKYAREKYLMKRDDEDVFIVVEE
jgi:cell division protein FtsB